MICVKQAIRFSPVIPTSIPMTLLELKQELRHHTGDGKGQQVGVCRGQRVLQREGSWLCVQTDWHRNLLPSGMLFAIGLLLFWQEMLGQVDTRNPDDVFLQVWICLLYSCPAC